jgi:hypothetical protein
MDDWRGAGRDRTSLVYFVEGEAAAAVRGGD